MRLSEILELSYNNRKDRTKKTQISEVYGIIYRIYCIPERKSYIGQTFSHKILLQYLQRHGILSRCKIHYRTKDYDQNKNKPLYKAMNTYPSDQFEVFEEKKVYGRDMAFMNQLEADYMKKYKSLNPKGYNLEEIGKKYSRLLKMLAEHYSFEIKENNYIDKTRDTRCTDVCFGKRFGLSRTLYTEEIILKKLGTIDVESVRLVKTSGELRLVVKEVGVRDNIRIYFKGSEEECVDFARKITDNVKLSESFRGEECYKYQTKLEKVLEFPNVTKVVGSIYGNKTSGVSTYLLIFYGKKDGKIQTLSRISFGGKKTNIEDSTKDAMIFVDLFAGQTKTSPAFTLDGICKN